jgi:Phage T7 capsid assembly protein.
MENVVQEEQIVEKSTVLNEEEVQATLNGEESEADVSLPSDQEAFEMPEKFKGKSAEEIARAYAELEKMKAQKQEDEPESEKETAQEEADDSEFVNPMLEEGRPEGSKDVPVDQFVEYLQEYDNTGELSADSYAKLEELGYNKQFVDEKIDYIKYKREKEVDAVLEPYGGQEGFKKVAEWAAANFTEQQLENINNQLASGNRSTQDAVLSSLYMGYKQSSGKSDAPSDVTLHTNQPQSTRTEGYATKSEYLKDAKDPRYEKDAGYRKQVEQKMLKTDMSKWY